MVRQEAGHILPARSAQPGSEMVVRPEEPLARTLCRSFRYGGPV